MAERIVGKPAPTFEMKFVDGEGEKFGKISLEDYRG